MHFFLDLEATPTEKQSVVRSTPAYVEIESHSVDPPGVGYIYVLACEAPGSFLVAACWGREFDRFTDPNVGPRFFRACPELGHLITEGINERLSRGAVIRMVDPDDGDLKWFVARVVAGLNVERVRDLVEHQLLRSASDAITAMSFVIREELERCTVDALGLAD
jgi:hypothetical protein